MRTKKACTARGTSNTRKYKVQGSCGARVRETREAQEHVRQEAREARERLRHEACNPREHVRREAREALEHVEHETRRA